MKKYTIRPLYWDEYKSSLTAYTPIIDSFYIYNDLNGYVLYHGIYKLLEQVTLDEAKEKVEQIYHDFLTQYLDEVE